MIPQACPEAKSVVGVDVAEPAEEVAFGVVVGRAVDGLPVGRRVGDLAALGALEVREPLLGRRPFCVSLAHRPIVRGAAGLQVAECY